MVAGKFNRGKLYLLNYDVIVVGGGMAGTCAAIEAARLGVKVALIQDRPILGGISSSEVGMVIGGAEIGGYRYARDSGILEELRLKEHFMNPFKHEDADIPATWDITLWEAVKTSGIELFLNCSCVDVAMKSEKVIDGVICYQQGTEKKVLLKGDFFIDATGDGTLAYMAGAEWRYGREARIEYDEDLAPIKADDKVLCSSLLFRSRDMGKPIRFSVPSFAKIYQKEEELIYRDHKNINKGYWWIEYGGSSYNTIGDNQIIYEELLKRLFGVWDHIKNRGEHNANYLVLEWISKIPGKRESRRIIGDYVMKQKDVQEGPLFEDRVAYGGWYIDFHNYEGMDSNDVSASSYYLQQPYSIPLRSLYSKNIENLFMAGRNISVTHVALMSTRVMGTCSTIGQAVGTAAAMCVNKKQSPRNIVKNNIAEIQQNILRHDGYIIGLANCDPSDLALHSDVKASSEAFLEVLHPIDWHPLDTDRSLIVAVGKNDFKNLELLFRNRTSRIQKIQVGISTANNFWDFSDDNNRLLSAEISPDDTCWIAFSLKDFKFDSELIRINVLKNEAIEWGFSNKEVVGTSASYRNPKFPERILECRGVWSTLPRWKYLRGSYCIRFDPVNLPFNASNIINGFTRPEAWANIWISDPFKPLPQYIELSFKEEVKLRSIHITFDTNLTPTFESLTHPVPECVKDYEVQYLNGEIWHELIQVRNNYQRKRIHIFSQISTSKLRLIVSATNGCKSARVYEIRAYEDKVK